MTYRDGTTHNALTGGTWRLDARRVWVWVHDDDTHYLEEKERT